MNLGDLIYCIVGNDEEPCHPKIIKGNLYKITKDFGGLIEVDNINRQVRKNRFITYKQYIINIRKKKIESFINVQD